LYQSYEERMVMIQQQEERLFLYQVNEEKQVKTLIGSRNSKV
jgi:hypothetical protein